MASVDADPLGHRPVLGWDIGGAHVKACLRRRGELLDVVQWACPLWQGLDRLEAVIDLAQARWPGLAEAWHAVTMTGEMVDLFANREDGVCQISLLLQRRLRGGRLRFYVGDAGGRDVIGGAFWCDAEACGECWRGIASANWLATARHTAARLRGPGVLVDIGSTTTDLVPFADGRVLSTSRSDAERLAADELVYQGVVRTPLCALGPRIDFLGLRRHVMNEFFATTADVYRLSGELRPEHDLHPAADGAAKDLPASRQRLARMIGLDARDASVADWQGFALAWREKQLAVLRAALLRVIDSRGFGDEAVLVAAGCGDFLVARLARGGSLHARACLAYAESVAGCNDEIAPRVQVSAPSVAMAMLFEHDRREEAARCGS